jgi:hypothetical protein
MKCVRYSNPISLKQQYPSDKHVSRGHETLMRSLIRQAWSVSTLSSIGEGGRSRMWRADMRGTRSRSRSRSEGQSSYYWGGPCDKSCCKRVNGPIVCTYTRVDSRVCITNNTPMKSSARTVRTRPLDDVAVYSGPWFRCAVSRESSSRFV